MTRTQLYKRFHEYVHIYGHPLDWWEGGTDFAPLIFADYPEGLVTFRHDDKEEGGRPSDDDHLTV